MTFGPEPRDFTDFALTTGDQVSRSRLDQLLSDRDVRAAAAYFEGKKMRLQADGIVDARFRRVSTKEILMVTVIPFVEQPPAGALQHIAVVARSPKAVRVSVGTIAVEGGGKDLVVREDNAVVDGKVVAGQGRLKNFVKCAVPSCAAAAAGCWVGGPAWMQCFCAWCGAGAVVCAALEVVLP